MAYKTDYLQQYGVLLEMQKNNLNVCTCGNCGGIILYDKEMMHTDEIECPHCKHEMAYSDNVDFYYENCYEIDNELKS